MSYLTRKEQDALASSMISAREKWYLKRKAVLTKQSLKASRLTGMDDLLKEILIVLLKIYYELKKPK